MFAGVRGVEMGVSYLDADISRRIVEVALSGRPEDEDTRHALVDQLINLHGLTLQTTRYRR